MGQTGFFRISPAPPDPRGETTRNYPAIMDSAPCYLQKDMMGGQRFLSGPWLLLTVTRAITPMHHVLYLPEILYNIFGHLAPDEDRARTHESLPGTRALAKLARTCQDFKEPALDVLWSELPALSALARCVPDALYSKRKFHYAFKRALTEAEWVTIRSYSRRVWIFLDCSLRDACLEEQSATMLLNYVGDALFPSIRFLSWAYGRPFPLLRTVIYPLKTLHLDFRGGLGEISECRNILESVGNLFPLVNNFRLYLSHPHVEFDRIVSGNILRWSNLRVLECSDVALSADTILHISRMPALTHLSFTLSKEVPRLIYPSDLVLVFPNLTWCEASCGCLLPVANLFARTRFPSIKELAVKFPGSPSKQAIRSLTTAIRDACSSGTLAHLSIQTQRYLSRRLSACDGVESNDHAITYDDLYPCTALGNLRSLKINLGLPVHLTDDLAELASAWPRLEELTINNDGGWRSAGGLTLHGLVQLLRACPALRDFCVLLDTPAFTHVPAGMDVLYPQRPLGCVNLVESPLPEVGVFADVVDVFVAIRFSPRLLMAWRRCDAASSQWISASPAIQTTFRSWRDLDEEVKARLAGAAAASARG